MLTLCCLPQGSDHNSAFVVKIHREGFVDGLIQTIKRIALDPTSTTSLTLWLVSIPIDGNFEESVKKLNLVDNSAVHTDEKQIRPILSPGLSLSSVISKPLAENHVHIIFKPRRSTGTLTVEEAEREDHVMNVVMARYAATLVSERHGKSPSRTAELNRYRTHQGGTLPIYDGRYDARSPQETRASPIQLFQPIFAHFLDDLSSDSPIPPETVRATMHYMQAASVLYGDEEDRKRALNPCLADILGSDMLMNADETSHDGMIIKQAAQISEPVVVLLEVCKNEIGSEDCDPSVQAGLAVARYWTRSKHSVVRDNSCCPTFLLAIAGPWFAILGAVFTSHWVVQPLTDFVSAGLDATLREPHYLRVARIMHSLRRGVDRLAEYYRNLQIISVGPQDLHPRFLPAIHAYLDEDGKVIEFKYIKPLEHEPTCVTFLARTIADPRRDVVVKFTYRYGDKAHGLLATHGLAPRLFYFGAAGVLDGDPSYQHLRMVVMEYLEGQSLHQLYHADQITKAIIPQVIDRLGCALRILHEQNYVFGDLRQPNVMITKHQKVKLIDFDWAGEHDKATYPLLLSPDVDWPAGVKALSVMKKEHDDVMLKQLLNFMGVVQMTHHHLWR